MFDKIRRPLGAPGVPRWVDAAITNAQLLALFGTPKTIIPAPPAGYHNIFLGALLYKPANTGVMTVPGTSEFSVKYTGVAGLELAQIETTGFMDQTTAQTRWVRPFTAASGNSAIVPVSAAVIVLQTLIADLTTGNAILRIRSFYRTLPDAI